MSQSTKVCDSKMLCNLKPYRWQTYIALQNNGDWARPEVTAWRQTFLTIPLLLLTHELTKCIVFFTQFIKNRSTTNCIHNKFMRSVWQMPDSFYSRSLSWTKTLQCHIIEIPQNWAIETTTISKQQIILYHRIKLTKKNPKRHWSVLSV